MGAILHRYAREPVERREYILAGPVKRREYILADQCLLTTVSDYYNRDIIEYLRGIAHNFLME